MPTDIPVSEEEITTFLRTLVNLESLTIFGLHATCFSQLMLSAIVTLPLRRLGLSLDRFNAEHMSALPSSLEYLELCVLNPIDRPCSHPSVKTLIVQSPPLPMLEGLGEGKSWPALTFLDILGIIPLADFEVVKAACKKRGIHLVNQPRMWEEYAFMGDPDSDSGDGWSSDDGADEDEWTDDEIDSEGEP